jgi:hypothetical protein
MICLHAGFRIKHHPEGKMLECKNKVCEVREYILYGIRFALLAVAILAGFLLLPSCSSRKAQSMCNADNPFYPQVFQDCETGSGDFGKWIVDDYGLPAYNYTMDQTTDTRALFWNSENIPRRDHWHQIGNNRILAIARNDGIIQVFNQDRGYKWLNWFSDTSGDYSGGFGYVKDGSVVWSTAYRYMPAGAFTRRVFGIGYYEETISYNGVSITTTTFAPAGDDPVILSEVKLGNTTQTDKLITYYEYWDVNIHQLTLAPIMSGIINPDIPAQAEQTRTMLNQYFTQTVAGLQHTGAFMVETELDTTGTDTLNLPISPDVSADFDAYPFPILFSPLSASSSISGPLDMSSGGYFFSKAEFFGHGGPVSPDAVVNGNVGMPATGTIPATLQGVIGLPQPFCFVHALPVHLKPRETVTIRYAYGLVPTQGVSAMLQAYSDPKEDVLGNTVSWWKNRLAYFAPDRDPVLHRETAWHSYYLQSAGGYSQYFKTHVVSQGGQYLYGHGMDGAPRDFALFSIPLVYLNPSLAKQVLETIMEMTTPDGQIAYSITGFGETSGMGIHQNPSDLDIFFLWAISEYLMATRDYGFLGQHVPFYSPGGLYFTVPTTVLDHVRLSLMHLTQTVGFGEHGLIRVRDGDWNDGILIFSPDMSLTAQSGESDFNTAFAATVLPLAAQAVSESDPTISAELVSIAEGLRNVMMSQWTGRWFLRGWLGNGQSLGADQLFLEPQPFAVIGGFATPAQQQTLINSIRTILDNPSPVGALILSPPSYALQDSIESGKLKPGMDINGGIWPAMNAFLTWAYFIVNPRLGWNSLNKNTLATHATIYPDIWYGIWTGPDSFNSPFSDRPGQAAASLTTALTDFPAMNANLDSSPLIALIKGGAGIIPEQNGIRIVPRFPLNEWTLNLPLMGITVSPTQVYGYYNGVVSGSMELTVPVPSQANTSLLQVSVDGAQTGFTITGSSVSFIIRFSPSQTTTWSVTVAQ